MKNKEKTDKKKEEELEGKNNNEYFEDESLNSWADKISQIKPINPFGGIKTGWVEISGIGKFKDLEIVPEKYDDKNNEITLNLTCDKWDKFNVTNSEF